MSSPSKAEGQKTRTHQDPTICKAISRLLPSHQLGSVSSMNWKQMLAYISGRVVQKLLLRNKYLATKNRILKSQIKGLSQLTNVERIRLA